MVQLDAAQVAAKLDRVELIDALADAFRNEFHAPPREHHALDDRGNLLLVMPAWAPRGYVGVKLVTVFPANSLQDRSSVHGSYSLFDGSTGIPLAILDGTELTRRRTAAASSLAVRYLANPDARRLLMIGTGAMADHVIDSHTRVRPIDAVKIWGRRPERAEILAREWSARGLAAEAAHDLESAVRWADIVSSATLSEQPLIEGRWLRPGQHIDLIGAFTPAMREADDATLRCSSIYIDTRAALVESGELSQGMASGAITLASIRGELGTLVRGQGGRQSAEEITLFKSVGCAVEDLAGATLALLRGGA